MKRKIAAIALGIVLPLLWVVGEATSVLPVDLFYGTAVGLQGPLPRMSKDGVSPVLLVEVDNASLDAHGPWPWQRGNVQDLIQKLSLWGARALVLDPSMLEPSTVPDPSFWATIPGSTALVMPLVQGGEGQPCAGRFPPALATAALFTRVERLAPPPGVPCLERFVWGFDNLPENGSLSWPLLGNDGRSVVPSLPVAALLASSAVDQYRSDWWSESEFAVVGARGEVHTNPDGTVYMRPYGPPGASVAHVSAVSVLSGEVSVDQFRDRIVVLGVTGSNLTTNMTVPFSAALQGNAMTRPEALANILGNLIEQDQYREAGVARFAALFLVLPAMLVVFSGLRLRKRWIGFAGAGVLLVVAMLGVVIVYRQLHLWIPPIGGVLVPVGAAVFLAFWPKPVRRTRPDPSTLTSLREASGLQAPPPRPRYDDTGTRQPVTTGTGLPPERPTTTSMPVRTADEASSVVMAARGQEGQIVRGPNGEFIQLGRYVDLVPLASGGMCKVYEGRDPVMDRRVAIKILRSDKAKGVTTEQRFLREAKVAGSLNHPNINTVFDYGQVDDILFLVLEFVDGVTLSQWVREHNGVQPSYVVAWARQIADALDTAHKAQVIHRDIKPSNFMVVHKTGSIKLMDFGVARTPDVSLTQAGTTVGTPNYMSPEQLQGSRVGPLADLYSFGVVLYQVLTQRLPFHGEGLTALCNNILKGQATRLSVHRPDLAGPVEDVIHKAFAVKPEDRFGSCVEFAEAFAKAASR
jgi:CHASE2 domain-containing sensor protein/tRNA A-37 threonylcarbamoyl transferase component Bud32